MALASALHKLDASAHRIPMHVAPAAAPLAQVNPLAATGGGLMRLFSTHPPTEERVARLRRWLPKRVSERGQKESASGHGQQE